MAQDARIKDYITGQKAGMRHPACPARELSHRLVKMQEFNRVLIKTTLPNIADRWRDLRLPFPSGCGRPSPANGRRWTGLSASGGSMGS